jgi:hypothetical protein
MGDCICCEESYRLKYVLEQLEKGFGIKVTFFPHATNGAHRMPMWDTKEMTNKPQSEESGIFICRACHEATGRLVLAKSCLIHSKGEKEWK